VGEDPIFECHCPVCDGETLARFNDTARSDEAAEHSVHVWSSLAEELKRIPQGAREDWWKKQITAAKDTITELEDRLYLPEAPSKQLEAWSQVLGLAS
jgi:hypothetical protein